jgi:hypothetical protein
MYKYKYKYKYDYGQEAQRMIQGIEPYDYGLEEDAAMISSNQYVRVQNTGGYVARFVISSAYDNRGGNMGFGNLTSDEITSPFSKTIDVLDRYKFPKDAQVTAVVHLYVKEIIRFFPPQTGWLQVHQGTYSLPACFKMSGTLGGNVKVDKVNC